MVNVDGHIGKIWGHLGDKPWGIFLERWKTHPECE